MQTPKKTKSVKISTQNYQILKRISLATGASITWMLNKAVESYVAPERRKGTPA